MDMDYLMLDSAFSGDKPEQTDTWEMFDGSYTYIPGESSSYGHYSSGWDVNGWGANGMGMYAYPHSTDGNNQNYHSNIRSSGGADSVSSGYLLDTDMKTANNKQVVRYTRAPRAMWPPSCPTTRTSCGGTTVPTAGTAAEVPRPRRTTSPRAPARCATATATCATGISW